MLSLFANLIYYFPGELALFHTLMSWACPGRAGRIPDESWACPRRVGEEPAQNINCYFFFLLPFFECVCECECE